MGARIFAFTHTNAMHISNYLSLGRVAKEFIPGKMQYHCLVFMVNQSNKREMCTV